MSFIRQRVNMRHMLSNCNSHNNGNDTDNSNLRFNKKKQIFIPAILISTLVIIGLIVAFSYFFADSILSTINNRLDLTMINDVPTLIITLSAFSVSIFQLLIEKSEENIFGISYKAIFFLNCVWDIFNFINCVCMLAVIIISTILVEVICSGSPKNMIQFILLIMTICITFRIFYFSFVASVKKSRIYYLINKKIPNPKRENSTTEKENYNLIAKLKTPLLGGNNYKSMDKRIINKLYGLTQLSDKKLHNSYIMEEIGILIHLYIHVGSTNSPDSKKEQIKKEIIKAINTLIGNDSRDFTALKNDIIEVGNNEFGIDHPVWKTIPRQINPISTPNNNG